MLIKLENNDLGDKKRKLYKVKELCIFNYICIFSQNEGTRGIKFKYFFIKNISKLLCSNAKRQSLNLILKLKIFIN